MVGASEGPAAGRAGPEAGSDEPKERICRHVIIPHDCPEYLGRENIRSPNGLQLSFRTPPLPEEHDWTPQPPRVEMGMTGPGCGARGPGRRSLDPLGPR